jgi:hypothetical protein
MENPEYPEKSDYTPHSFESMGKAKVDSLTEAVREIEEQIRQRRILSESFVKEAEKMKSDIKTFLMQNTVQGEGDSEFARERSELRKKQIEISESQLKEKVGCWQDISELKKELRDKEKELHEKQSRADMIKDILGGDGEWKG